jgi:hypothetical protein
MAFEKITFTDPYLPPLTVFRISLISMDWLNSRIMVHLRVWDPVLEVYSTDDVVVVAEYSGAEAVTRLASMSIADYSAIGASMHMYVLDQLVFDGKIPDGTPDDGT